jgi:hypothetical protein
MTSCWRSITSRKCLVSFADCMCAPPARPCKYLQSGPEIQGQPAQPLHSFNRSFRKKYIVFLHSSEQQLMHLLHRHMALVQRCYQNHNTRASAGKAVLPDLAQRTVPPMALPSLHVPLHAAFHQALGVGREPWLRHQQFAHIVTCKPCNDMAA